jgi:two-component system sensor histidine kinase/response regulator
LLALINDILDLSKIEAGKFVLEKAPINIDSIIANIRPILTEHAQAKNTPLQAEVESVAGTLYGDPTRLQQALLNYASNVLKFTENGAITLRAYKQEETPASVLIRFEVEDTGIGIPPEAIQRLSSVNGELRPDGLKLFVVRTVKNPSI